jgi:DNA integrity scanning protein DisA with diadenylate cyclase activity
MQLSSLDIAYISTLEKLYKAIIEKNFAHLEVAGLPDKVTIGTAALIIQKKKTTITLENLFKD